MGPREHSRFKIVSQAVASDSSLTEDRGWQKMDVRWLITSATMPSLQTVVGKTTMPPGMNAQHSMHRHPNVEEWEYVVQGEGIKRVGDEAFVLRAGDIAFVPRNEKSLTRKRVRHRDASDDLGLLSDEIFRHPPKF